MISVRKIFVASLLTGISVAVQAQPQSLYHFGSVTQRYQMNPAFQPTCNVYVGIPSLNSIYAGLGFSSIRPNDFAWLEGNKMVTAFDSGRSKEPLLNKFKPGNLIFGNYSQGLLNFGFRFKSDWYFTYDLSIKNNTIFSFPKEFAQLPISGNVSETSDGLTIPLKHFGFKEELYLEHAFGLSKEISPELTIGGRLKIIQGLVNISTKTNNANFIASDTSWYYDKPIDGRVSTIIPGLMVKDPVTNGITNDTGDIVFSPGNVFKNMGLALDLGIDYRPSDLWSLSLSVVDLGFIHWNSSTSARMTVQQDSAFRGLYLTPDLETNRALVGRASLDAFRDSILNQFKKNTGELEGYSTMLTWKIYAGASYFIWPEKLSIGLLSRTEMYYKRVYERITLSTNFFPARWVSATASYTFLNNSFSNMGLGINFKFGPVNLYVITDYYPFHVAKIYNLPILPYQNRMFNAQVGLNLLFGCGKKVKDRPMIDAF